MRIQNDVLLFVISGISLIFTLILFIYYYASKPKNKVISFDDIKNERTATLRHTSTINFIEETETIDETEDDNTELLGDETELMDGSLPIKQRGIIGRILNGIYQIERPLGKGGMSAVYLCKNLKIGNKWAVKHIFHEANSVLAEENILKQLNHINLPKIVDIFQDKTGTYIVESYIEGIGLNKVIERNEVLDEDLIASFALQLSDVLSYLHNIKPYPIIHRDLKPSNIIVTKDDKLVLIDFGISKESINVKDEIIAVSRNYAAPEQFQGLSDERTDIYSYGVILYQLATRHLPNMPGFEALLKDSISIEIAEIILKCLEKDTYNRYQSVEELKEDLGNLKYSKIKNVKHEFKRKVALGIAAMFTVSTIATGVFGYVEYDKIKVSEIALKPDVIFLTEQQKSDLIIEQLMQAGKKATFDSRFVSWEYSDINVARIEANEIIAMNLGETKVVGKYRNKVVKLNVSVVKPDGMTDIRLKYNTNFDVRHFAGSGVRELTDGDLKKADMISPASIDVAEDGSIYFVDSGNLRQIIDGQVSTIKLEPAYITPKIVKAIDRNAVCFVTNEWQDEDGYFRGIAKVTEDGVEGFYIVAASEHDILDMTTNKNGEIFILEKSLVEENSYIKHFVKDSDEPVVVAEVPVGSTSMAFDSDDSIYLSDKEKSVIYKYNKDKKVSEYFAGVKDEKNFIDGVNARFYMPYKIKIYGDYLYILDFNVLRRISIVDEIGFDVETVAGKAGIITSDMTEGKGYEIIFEKSIYRDMTIDKNGDILITDPELSIIRKIKYIPKQNEVSPQES